MTITRLCRNLRTLITSLVLIGCVVTLEQTKGWANYVQTVEVKGNQRIEKDTVILYSGIKAGDSLDQASLNKALKALYETNLFADASVNLEGARVVISVLENPIVNQVVFEGNRHLSEDLLKTETQLKPRNIFTNNRVQADLQRILALYRRQGRFAAVVEPKIIKLEQNRVNVVFEIKEGAVTHIKKITFIGNKKFSSSKLANVIRTKENRWYRFLTTDDTYDPERINFDRELLRRHYIEQGYVDFRVLSSIVELSPDKSGFFVTFNIEEGERYKVQKIEINNQLKEIKTPALEKKLLLKSNDWYNGILVEKMIDLLTDSVGEQGYAFAKVEPRFEKHDTKKTVDIVFDIKEGPRVFIGRIDIQGNIATYDKVIRREFRLAEGDAYNSSKLHRSEQRLYNLDFFSRINIDKETGAYPDKVNLKVDVKEKPTGEISLAVGVSSYEKFVTQARFLERNFMGRGQELSADLTLSRRTRDFEVGFTEPYFLDRNLSAGIDVFKTRYDQLSQIGYIHHRQGGTLRLGYHITEPLTQRLWYTLRQDNISGVKADASTVIQEQKGSRVISLVGQKLTYEKLNSLINPSKGYLLSVSNEFAGVGGQASFHRHIGEARFYYPVVGEVVLGLRGVAGVIQKIRQNLRVVDRFFLGGDTLRGFEFFGVGPREATKGEAVGGKYYYTASTELSFPLGLPNELGIRGGIFCDAGSTWRSGIEQTDDIKIKDSSKARVAIGFGIAWSSPLGPIRLDIAKALKYEPYDRRQVVLFSFRHSF